MTRRRIIATLQRHNETDYAQALQHRRRTTKPIRKCATANQIPFSTLQRKNENQSLRGSNILKKRRKKLLLTHDEKHILKQSLQKFSSRWTFFSWLCQRPCTTFLSCYHNLGKQKFLWLTKDQKWVCSKHLKATSRTFSQTPSPAREPMTAIDVADKTALHL